MSSLIDQAKFSQAGRNMPNAQIKVGLLNGHTQTFDTVVCAASFYMSRFHSTRDELLIVMAAPVNDDHPLNFLYVTADLYVTLEGADVPENIWLVSVSTYLRFARISIIYQ